MLLIRLIHSIRTIRIFLNFIVISLKQMKNSLNCEKRWDVAKAE